MEDMPFITDFLNEQKASNIPRRAVKLLKWVLDDRNFTIKLTDSSQVN